MIALILKELRCYAHQPKYRRTQFIILCTLAFALLAIAFEQFALSRGRPQILVGESIYALLIPLFFCLLLGLVVPLQAVESFQIERHKSNWNLLNLTPIGHRKFLLGKLIGTVLALLWCIGLTIPTLRDFGLHGRIGDSSTPSVRTDIYRRTYRLFFYWSMFHLARTPGSRDGTELCRCVVIEFYSTYRSCIDAASGYPNYPTRIAAGVESLVCDSCDRKV